MEVFFPKFKLDQKYKMHELLKQMGVQKIFLPWADLSDLMVWLSESETREVQKLE